MCAIFAFLRSLAPIKNSVVIQARRERIRYPSRIIAAGSVLAACRAGQYAAEIPIKPSNAAAALVLSDPAFNQAGYTVMAMITTGANSQWLGDVPLTDLAAAGLPHPCLIRWKVMTLDNRLIERCSGALSETDRSTADSHFRKYIFD